MGKSKPIVVGERRFASKEKARQFISGILQQYGRDQRVSDDHAEFLAELLRLHPEADHKIGCGVSFFTVKRNSMSNGFWLTRTDGSETDWSYIACLTPPTPETEARAGFRSAIRSQILDFRNAFENSAGPKVCPITHEPLTAANLHIDHEVPFEELLDSFLRERGLALGQIAVKPTCDGSTTTELADDDLRIQWEEFHRLRARLRAVSARANLSLLRRL